MIDTGKNIVVLAFTYSMLYGDFGLKSYSVDSDEVMKQGNKTLNASLLQYFRSVNRFIASSLGFLFSV
jgi:hypothetical protein